MSFLSYIAIAIATIVLGIVALFYLAKGLLALMCWFVSILPTLIKATIFWAILVVLCFALELTDVLPSLPGFIYPLLYVVVLCLISVRKFIKHGSIFTTSSGEYKGYVLNRKSKVIHDKYSDSGDTVSPHNRKELSYSEASELVRQNDRYRFKKNQ